MARLRAVVVIHAPGFGGRPAVDQLRVAAANASWTASSAMSMSPKRRTRVATARPDSCRKTSPIPVACNGPTPAGLARRLVLERTHLHRSGARPGGLGGPRQG